MTNLDKVIKKLEEKVKELALFDIQTSLEGFEAPKMDESMEDWYSAADAIDFSELIAAEKPATVEKKEALINGFSGIFQETKEKLIKQIAFTFIPNVVSKKCQNCGIENDGAPSQLIMIGFKTKWKTRILCSNCLQELGWDK